MGDPPALKRKTASPPELRPGKLLISLVVMMIVEAGIFQRLRKMALVVSLRTIADSPGARVREGKVPDAPGVLLSSSKLKFVMLIHEQRLT